MSQATQNSTSDSTAKGSVAKPLSAGGAGELDGQLLAAVTELRQRDAEVQGLKPIMGGPDAAEADRALSYCDEVLWPRQKELIKTITETPAGTPEGLRAKAQALDLWLNREVPVFNGETFEDRADTPELLAMSLARDIVGKDSLTARHNPPHPDAELIAACEDYLRIERAFEVASNALDDDVKAGDPAWATLDPIPALENKIVALRATTAEGITARARCMAFTYMPGHTGLLDNPDMAAEDRFRAALMRDLVRLERGDGH